MSDRTIRSRKVRVGDMSIAYHIREATSSPSKTIVFLHGFPFNKNMWRQQLLALDDSITGIAIDIRGHGKSTRGHGFFSIDVFAKDLIAFLKKVEIDSAVLCGISMGGYIALRTYELAPEKISGLILADTHNRADDNAGKQKRFDSIQAILNHGRRPFSIGFVETIFSSYTLQNNPDPVELIKSSIRRNSLSTICATHLALASRTDTSAVLNKINVPTLLIRGAEDKITPETYMQNMHSEIDDSKFIQMSNCGHLPNLEDPAKFNVLMSDFLRNDVIL